MKKFNIYIFNKSFLEAATSRGKFGEMLQARRAKSADDLVEVAKNSAGLCKALDDFWCIEQALLRMLCGSTAEARCSAKILGELPSASRDVDMATSLQRLETMSASAAMRFSPTGVQASLRFILKNLNSLQQGITLSQKLDSCSALVKKALNTFAHFLVMPSPDKKGDTLKGEVAYAWLWKHLQEAKDKAAPIAGLEVEALQTFLWLAAPGTSEQISTFLKNHAEASSKAGKAVKKPLVASAGGSSSSTSAAPAAKKANTSKENAMRYFA